MGKVAKGGVERETSTNSAFSHWRKQMNSEAFLSICTAFQITQLEQKVEDTDIVPLFKPGLLNGI